MTDPVDVLIKAVQRNPGSTARQLARLLEANQSFGLDRRTINQILYRLHAIFQCIGGSPPRWYLREETNSSREQPVPRLTYTTGNDVTGSHRLYAWQEEALAAWTAAGKRGIVEAVTGTGKTELGIAAAAAELKNQGCVVVLVPSVELMQQWKLKLSKALAGEARIGCLGGGERSITPESNAVIAVVNSLREEPLIPTTGNGLLIADECHRYGSEVNSRALIRHFPNRLGLSATYMRSDKGHEKYLEPYFAGVCYRVDYTRAIADDVVAHFAVALVGARFTFEEQLTYTEASEEAGRLRFELIKKFNLPEEPFGEFIRDVNLYAQNWSGWLTTLCRQYLSAFERKRRVLAECDAKRWILAQLESAIRKADRTIVFTESIQAARAASEVLQLIDVPARAIHSKMAMDERRAALEEFSSGSLRVIVAPRVLDEGVDVPAADLGIILAASRSSRQMIQRMGRVLRRKSDDRRARFVVAFVENTSEDPARGAHEDFLNQLTDVAEDIRVFPAAVDRREVVRYLKATKPVHPVRRPRYAGDPPRKILAHPSQLHGFAPPTEAAIERPAPEISELQSETKTNGSPPLETLHFSSASNIDGRRRISITAGKVAPHNDCDLETACWYCRRPVLAKQASPGLWTFFDTNATRAPHRCSASEAALELIPENRLPRNIWAEIMRRRASGGALPTCSFQEKAQAQPRLESNDGKFGGDCTQQGHGQANDQTMNPSRTGGNPQQLPSLTDARARYEWTRCSSCGTRVVGGIDLCARCLSEA